MTGKGRNKKITETCDSSVSVAVKRGAVAIRHFKLTSTTMATTRFSEHLVSVPAGAILRVDSDDLSTGGSVLVQWDDKFVRMFAADLLMRAEELTTGPGHNVAASPGPPTDEST